MIAGCYDLHLYCDGIGCAAGEYGEPSRGEVTGDETGAQARSRARKRGWKLFRNGKALCPTCNKAGVKVAPDAETVETPLDDEELAARQRLGGLATFAEDITHATRLK